jgi:hypothetical protein
MFFVDKIKANFIIIKMVSLTAFLVICKNFLNAQQHSNRSPTAVGKGKVVPVLN